MKIIANGEFLEVNAPMTLRQLLDKLQVSVHTAVLEHNGQIVSRDNWVMELQDGDSIEILQFLGGG